MSDFSLHEQLARDCLVVGEFPLSVLLLMNDSQYPWFILVPRRAGISEIHQLSEADQQQLLRESSAVSRALESVFKAEKINIGALGNVVPQLHVHHVARFQDDPVWPAPVWGKLANRPYEPEAMQQVAEKMSLALLQAGAAFSSSQ